MTFATVIPTLFATLPWLEERYRESFAYLEDEDPLPYLVFGSVLVPTLEQALVAGDLAVILKLSAFLEEASEDSRKDPDLEILLRIEIGDWLGRLQHEDHLAMWLGSEARRVCRYIPGLAAQRTEDAAAKKVPIWKRLLGVKEKQC